MGVDIRDGGNKRIDSKQTHSSGEGSCMDGW